MLKAMVANISSIQTTSLPTVDDAGVARMLRALEGEDWENTD